MYHYWVDSILILSFKSMHDLSHFQAYGDLINQSFMHIIIEEAVVLCNLCKHRRGEELMYTHSYRSKICELIVNYYTS